MSDPILSLKNVATDIAQYHILHDVSFDVPRGKVTMLLGRNGARKTTTIASAGGDIAVHLIDTVAGHHLRKAFIESRLGSPVNSGFETVQNASFSEDPSCGIHTVNQSRLAVGKAQKRGQPFAVFLCNVLAATHEDTILIAQRLDQ